MWNLPEKIEIREDERKGRSIIAKEEIEMGESILMEEPYCRILFGDNIEEVCDTCFNYLRLPDSHFECILECQECKKIKFCSKKCMEESKAIHHFECGILKLNILQMISNKVGVSFDRSRLLTRFVIKLIVEFNDKSESQREQNNGNILISNINQINSLVDNQEKFLQSTKDVYQELALEILKIPKLKAEIDKLENKDIITDKLLVKISCIIDSNSFGIPKFPLKCSENESSVSELVNPRQKVPNSSLELSNSLLNPSILGWGLFSYSSLLNHSCDPNCDFIGVNPVHNQSSIAINLIANRKIQKDEEITINYVEIYDTRRDRIKNLLNTKHFICHCERCTTPFLNCNDSYIQGFCCSKCFKINDFDYKSNSIPIIQSESVSNLSQPDNITSIIDDQDYLISQLTESYHCSSCGEIYYGSEVTSIQNEFLDTIQEAENMNIQKYDLQGAIHLVSSLIEKYHPPNSKSLLPHPLNHLLYKCYKLLTFWNVIVKDWNSVNCYVSKMINSHLLLFQNQHNLEISNLYSTKAIALSHLGHVSESNTEWNKCLKIRQICSGNLSYPYNISSVNSLIRHKDAA
ncbi:SET domain protein [Cryptosporidium meleagridis]|uniref:SET domain protein n=1 Tax=Cryptosporidium meleagridis TaxID=93969 RepID=A0A2P4YXR9_9CRYT|nr:SET domain protein [Cryptosporidium meleagridis]